MATAAELLAGNDVIWIDVVTRTINIPKNLTLLGVTSDENVQKLSFAMSRYYNGIDLSLHTIRINYENAQGEGDVYPAVDIEVTEDTISFTWIVSRHATMYAGNVKFTICAPLTDDESNREKEFNTIPTTLPVIEGLETDQADVMEEYPDAIAAAAVEALNKAKQNGDFTPVKGEDYYTPEEAEAFGRMVVDNANGQFANAIKGVKSGEIVRVDDVSPIEHTVKVKVSGEDIDPTTVAVTACGKNILEVTGKTTTQGGVTFTVNSNGSITVNGTATENTFYKVGKINLANCGQYYLSGSPTNSGVTTSLLYIHDIESYADVYDYGNGKTFTPTGGTCDVVIGVYKGYTASNLVYYPMVEAGTEKTEFEKFTKKVAYNPATDGKCSVVSVSPTMTVFTDTPGVIVEVEYSRDTTKMFESYVLTDRAIGAITAEIEDDMVEVLEDLNDYAESFGSGAGGLKAYTRVIPAGTAIEYGQIYVDVPNLEPDKKYAVFSAVCTTNQYVGMYPVTYIYDYLSDNTVGGIRIGVNVNDDQLYYNLTLRILYMEVNS